jgi:streptomycin 6-kinase
LKLVEIEHGPHALAMSWLLVGWLASQLQWKSVDGKRLSDSELVWRFHNNSHEVKVVCKRLPEGEPLITLKSWFDELRHLRPRSAGGPGPFPKKLLETAEGLIRELFAESSPEVVLHGDCHHFNILLSQRGWLVIDPKGVVGPAEYEPTPLLTNPWGEFLQFPDPVRVSRRRIAILSEALGIESERLHAWAVAHCVLSAWWDLQEDGTGGEYSIACGEILLRAGVG